MIKEMNLHYSFTNPATVHDEEALTALELAGRQGAKINEVIRDQNALRTETENHLEDQDTTIAERMEAQDTNIVNIRTVTVPADVKAEVQKQINDGTFDNQINETLGTLPARLDNLIASVPEGGTTMDAEVIDGRSGVIGMPYDNVGNAIREQMKNQSYLNENTLVFTNHTINSADGLIVASKTRLLSNILKKENVIDILFDQSVYKIRLYLYDENYNYLGTEPSWHNYFNFEVLTEEVKYICFTFAKSDDTEITISEGVNVSLLLKDSVITPFKNFKWLPMSVSSSNGSIYYNEARLCSQFMDADFALIKTTFKNSVLFTCYDESFHYLGNSRTTSYRNLNLYPSDLLEGTKYIQIIVMMRDSTQPITEKDADIEVYLNNSDLADKLTVEPPAHMHELLNVAYSSLGFTPINTKGHFHCAAHTGFNALKGDVRITADGVLIMSHDEGYTLNTNGEITSYNKSNQTKWLDKNYSEVKELVYESTFDFKEHVCSFEEYLQLCVEFGKIAYVTIRENEIHKVTNEVYRLLVKYDMVKRCVVNSYEYDALMLMRKLDGSIPLSLVFQYGDPISQNDLLKVKTMGNAIATLFYYPLTEEFTSGAELWEQSANIISFAHEIGVVLHMAQVQHYYDYQQMIQKGVKGFHIVRPFLEYNQINHYFYVGLWGDELELWNENFSRPRYEGECSKDADGVITVKNIMRENSNQNYIDGVPLMWSHRLPYDISVKCSQNENARVEIVGECIKIYTDNINGDYYLKVTM